MKGNAIKKALIMTAFLFFIFGFLTWINGTLIAFFKKTFELSHLSSYLVTFAYYLSYTIMAIPSSFILDKIGFKNGMALGLLIMALGCAIFIPAAYAASYVIFLIGLFSTGIGLTILQTAVNPYVTLIGSHDSAAKRMSFMGFSNKIGGIIGQVIFGSILLHGSTVIILEDELRKVIAPYIFLAILFIIISIVLKKSNWFPEIDDKNEKTSYDSLEANDKKNIFQFPNLILGVVALFFAGAVEVMAIDSIINYGLVLNFPEEKAMLFGSFTLIAMILGYLSGMIFIPKYIKQENFLKYGAIVGAVLTIIAIYSPNRFLSVISIASLGFVNALFWPAIWPLALENLGRFTKVGSALLIMSVSGGAIMPLFYGHITDKLGNAQLAYWVIVPCYLFIVYYATKGYKKREWVSR